MRGGDDALFYMYKFPQKRPITIGSVAENDLHLTRHPEGLRGKVALSYERLVC